jgi:hypothetical protein
VGSAACASAAGVSNPRDASTSVQGFGLDQSNAARCLFSNL